MCPLVAPISLSLLCAHGLRLSMRAFSLQFEPEKFPGMKWKVRLPDCGDEERYVTYALFERGRGVVTGLKHMSDVPKCNKLLVDLPSYERGFEYRVMTAAEMRDAAIRAARSKRLAAKAKAKTRASAKRKREAEAEAEATTLDLDL